MNQRNTKRTILAVIIATALVVSVGSLTALHTFPADATKPKHNDDDNDSNGNNRGDNVVNTLSQQPQLAPLSMETAANTGGNVESDDVATLQQQSQPQSQQQAQQPQAQQAQQASSSTNAACGQVVSGVVNLTSNLNCSGDGIIVGGPNTVINMNGFSITGP
ncbi:MAG TPA: hypothetical protein VE548_05910, partial [Nitrososphaeraceae archaeon]|nr:hypothetical protein [Nitrososphaeraceae archaeon]